MYILFRQHVISPNSKVYTNLSPETERKMCEGFLRGTCREKTFANEGFTDPYKLGDGRICKTEDKRVKCLTIIPFLLYSTLEYCEGSWVDLDSVGRY